MRVVRANGETANMVGLGEDLQLRIEIDQDSAFGLFARRLEARTDNGELMNLIDDSGCPVNELIFPTLELEDGTRALYADFKAFRFPSTPIVNFIATVQFCQELCEPMQCSGGLESYGKRKKRSLVEGIKEITVSTTPLTAAQDEGSKKSRFPRETESLDSRMRSGRVLPEHVDLGLRLTVGEGILKKPFLQSTHGEGHFPEMSAQTEPSPNAYFPGGYPVDAAGNPDYVCSPHSTIIASVIIVVVLNIITITAFVVFYRYKRKEWVKRSMTSEVGRLRPVSSRVHPATAPPPPLPSRPSTASGALGPSPPIYNSSNSEVTYKDPYHPASRQRFGSLNASSASMTSLPKP